MKVGTTRQAASTGVFSLGRDCRTHRCDEIAVHIYVHRDAVNNVKVLLYDYRSKKYRVHKWEVALTDLFYIVLCGSCGIAGIYHLLYICPLCKPSYYGQAKEDRSYFCSIRQGVAASLSEYILGFGFITLSPKLHFSALLFWRTLGPWRLKVASNISSLLDSDQTKMKRKERNTKENRRRRTAVQAGVP